MIELTRWFYVTLWVPFFTLTKEIVVAVKVARKFLQQDKYDYVWTRDKGDGEYTGLQDQIRIDKDEGYEVLYFIQKLMNKHSLKTSSDVHKIEDALHHPDLRSEVMRDKLTSQIEAALDL